MRSDDTRPTDGLGGSVLGSLLDEGTLQAVADLNRAYLRLCVDCPDGRDPRFRLADLVLRRLSGLSGPAFERASGCPFALFELRLPRVIAAALSDPGSVEGSGVADRSLAFSAAEAAAVARRQLFVYQALFFAWHLVRTSPLTGRLSLGCTPGVEPALRALSPSRLCDCSALDDALRPRWPAHERFWTTLLDAVEASSESALRRVHCLGLQLLAGELDAKSPDPAALRAPA